MSGTLAEQLREFVNPRHTDKAELRYGEAPDKKKTPGSQSRRRVYVSG